MRKRNIYQINIVVIMVLILGNSLLAEQNTGNTLETSNKWNIDLTPYFWAAEIDGYATLRGRTGPVKVGFSDLLENLDIAFMGRAEAWKGKWGLFFDALYMDLGAGFSTPQGLVSADIDMKMTMLEFGIGHRLLETTVGQDNNQKFSFDLLGGGRYMNLEGEVDIRTNGPLSGLGLPIGGTFKGRQEWVDPIVGGRLRWDLNDKLAAAVRFDFGGFNIGDGSKLTWNLLAGIDYKLKENMSLKVGYRIFDIDYDSGSGNRKFGLDAQFRGPIFGLTYRF